MNPLFTCIKSVGFDLDQTLYPPNQEINDLIRNRIARKILENNLGLKDISNVRAIYDKKYEEVGSWIKIFNEMGINEPKKELQKCLSDPKIVDFIKRDDKLKEIMKFLSSKYFTFLITNSPKALSIPKLNKIGVGIGIFHYCIFGDSPDFSTKLDGRVFKNYLNSSSYLPNQHVYIGDNLKTDILPPKSLGMKTIAVGKEILEADFSVKNIHNIEKLLL